MKIIYPKSGIVFDTFQDFLRVERLYSEMVPNAGSFAFGDFCHGWACDEETDFENMTKCFEFLADWDLHTKTTPQTGTVCYGFDTGDNHNYYFFFAENENVETIRKVMADIAGAAINTVLNPGA